MTEPANQVVMKAVSSTQCVWIEDSITMNFNNTLNRLLINYIACLI